MYNVLISRSALKEVADLPDHYPRLITRHIGELALDPRPPNSKKLTDRNGYSLRVGSYRILYEINDRSKTITVRRIKHRRDAYRE